MPITIDQINRWRASASEHERLEFKEAKTQFDNRRLMEYCVAIANEGGGHILLGISNVPPRTVVGTNAFNNPAGIAEKLFQHLQFRVDVEAVEYGPYRIVVFSIPSRPRGHPYHLDGRFLMRSGEALVPMSADHLRKICEEGNPDWLDLPAAVNLKTEDVLFLIDTNRLFRMLKIPHPTDVSGIIDRLRQERLIDETNGTYSIRRIAGILAARRLASFPDLERKVPRVIVYDGVSKTKEKIHQDGIRGYALGFGGLIRFIDEQLPQNEVIEGAFHQQVKLVPDFVIRELVANALIHQDFSVIGKSVMVEIYANRVEISNPGSPIVPVPRFADENQSRNERLAGILRRIGICEEKGSGIDRVLQTVEAYQLPAPKFRADEFSTKVTIFGAKKFTELASDERIWACYWHCALKWVMSERMTNQSLRKRFKLSESHSSTISQVISETIKKQLIKRDDSVGASHRLACYMPIWA